MRINELTNAPQWLLDAVVRDEDVTIDAHGRVQWHSGNFLGGDFLGGNFLGGNFRGGDFWGEKLTIKPLCVYGLTWQVIITGEQMEIGCQRHTHTEWAEFDDDAISVMESRAADFWRENKAMLLSMCALHAQRSKAGK
jgi:hypothetical protein